MEAMTGWPPSKVTLTTAMTSPVSTSATFAGSWLQVDKRTVSSSGRSHAGLGKSVDSVYSIGTLAGTTRWSHASDAKLPNVRQPGADQAVRQNHFAGTSDRGRSSHPLSTWS